MAGPNKKNNSNTKATVTSENITKAENIVNIESTNSDVLVYEEKTNTKNTDTETVDLNAVSVSSTTSSVVEEPKISTAEIDVNSLLKTIQDLTNEVKELKKNQVNQDSTITQQPYQTSTQSVIPVPVPVNHNSNMTSEMGQILQYLTNKKSDKEVTIVHNQERVSGLSTAIHLTGVSIDFHKKGEVATLSWQQFEECVSRYRNWFDKKIILLSYEDRELADRYHIPYIGQDGFITLTREKLLEVHKLDVNKLQELYNSLCPEDQENLCTYWIGKCYEKAPGYYERYKVETLNRLSNRGAFDNILASMNNDFIRERNANSSSNTVVSGTQGQQRSIPIMNAVEI